MPERDIMGKMLEEHNDVFADIINVLGFGGRTVIRPDSLRPGPTAAVYRNAEGRGREQFRDTSKFCVDTETVLVLFGLENQTAEDDDMVFRVMRYDGAAYKQQSDRKKKYPVITLVLYFGLKRWKAPKSIHEAISEGTPGWQRVIELVPDYRLNLVEVAFLPDEVREKFNSDFQIVAEYFHALRVGSEDEFYKGPGGRKAICHVEELMDFFRIYARRDLYEKAREIVETCEREGETVSMFEMFEQVEARAMKQGLSQGIGQGVRALIETCRDLGENYDATLKRVMDKFSMGREEAEKKMQQFWGNEDMERENGKTKL